jgi:hypothetical protein
MEREIGKGIKGEVLKHNLHPKSLYPLPSIGSGFLPLNFINPSRQIQ